MAYQISFGRISDQRIFESEEYKKWNDGVQIKEVTTSIIGKLSDEIAEMFGFDKITVAKKWLYIDWEEGLAPKLFINAAMYYRQGHLVFNSYFLALLANSCGVDVIVGILAHEIGHRLVYLTLLEKGLKIAAWENELCADFTAGLILRLSGRDKSALVKFFQEYATEGSDSHPDGKNRIAALQKGYTWVERDRRGAFLRIPSFAKSIDTRGLFTNPTLAEMFTNEILNPFRQRSGNL